MEYQNIYDILFNIMQKFPFSPALARERFEKDKDLPLTGDVWIFGAVDMVYLFFEVEKEFGIHIAPKDLLHYRFNTIRQIASIVSKYLSVSSSHGKEVSS